MDHDSTIIEKILANTSALKLSDPTKLLDIEHTISTPIISLVKPLSKNRNISFRTQFIPKRIANGMFYFLLKKDAHILDSIYSWCGFKSLSITLSIQENNVRTSTHTINYSNIAPGWWQLPPIPLLMNLVVEIQYKNKIVLPTVQEFAMIKQIYLSNDVKKDALNLIDSSCKAWGSDYTFGGDMYFHC